MECISKTVVTLSISLLYLVSWNRFAIEVQAHVGLTFPPARNYDLDFLDNIRTKPPCGMPKGLYYKHIQIVNQYKVYDKIYISILFREA
jgi:hypothetical protein